MIPDQKERECALDPSRSFIVEAPAGSGKTALLIQRYLRLLSVVERPESVVAMTFTRKASAETRERIVDVLIQAENGSPVENEYEQVMRDLAQAVLQQDRKKGWNLLADTARMQIQTIDSLCALLTRQMPVVSEFGGIGRVVEEPSDLYRMAARRTLRRLAEGNESEQALFQATSLHFDNDMAALEGQVARMLQKRDQWRFLGEHPERPLIDAFCHLLDRASEELRDIFRERGIVDFTEVTRAAIRALGTPEQPTDLLYSLDYRIEHLLVDEFQDTSLAQYDLINALTAQWSDGDGHTLFLVGDPMQSIYRFREAEVSLFLRSWQQQRLGPVRLTPLRLTTNFRSTPEILNWVGQKFSPIMPEDDELHGAVQFRPAAASREKTKVEPQVIRLIDDPGEKEARAVTEILRRAGQKGTAAILVRSRSHISAILPALRNADIPYEALEIDQLKEQQHILDLISLTRAVVHLGDRVSWLACLRAPWCGLTLSDLSALAENQPSRTILDLLSDAETMARLSPEGRSRAARAQEILSAAVSSAGHVSLRELIEETWLALGGPAILPETNQREDADTYFNLLESFEEGGIIRDFSLLNQHLECLYAKPSGGVDRVQVMTIHQAKGLEFDRVILPQLGKGTRSSDRELLVWTEEIEGDGTPCLRVAAQPQKGEDDPEYTRVAEEIKKKDRHELKRLFYVACTRARNELYLLGSAKRNKQGTALNKASDSTFLGLIWDGEKAEFDRELARQTPVQKSLFAAEGLPPKTVLRRLPTSWRAPQLDHSISWHPELQRATASARKISYEWVSGTGRHVGTVVHELLKRIAEPGSGAWTRERIGALNPVIKPDLLRLGVARSEEALASAQVIRALTNVLASERGRWILDAHSDAHSEWPIAGRIQDKLISGTIDRMFRDEQGRLWIIDFKTSEHEGGRLEAFLNEEQRRYQAQLDNYGTLMSRLVAGPIWLGLYFPLLDGWREWQLEQEAVLTA